MAANDFNSSLDTGIDENDEFHQGGLGERLGRPEEQNDELAANCEPTRLEEIHAFCNGCDEGIHQLCIGNGEEHVISAVEPVPEAFGKEEIRDMTLRHRKPQHWTGNSFTECASQESSDQGRSSLSENVARDSDDIGTELPEDIKKGVLELKCESSASPSGYCDVYLVGTAHVSQESCRQVQAVIRHLKPQVVFLELCESRSSMLMPQSLKVPTLKEMMEMWRTKHMNTFGILYSWFLAKVADKLEVFPGSEFRVAFEEAVACGAKVILGDRHVQVTLKRTWMKMSSWHKMKLILSMVFQAVFLPSTEELNQMMQEMDNIDVVTLLIQEMSKSFPTLLETLVHERDMYMAAMLHRVAQHCSLIVAVVGKGHLSGIAKNWNEDISVKDLLEVPGKKSRWLTSFKCLSITALVVGGLAITSGLYLSVTRE